MDNYSTPEWEKLFKHRDYCDICGRDITFDGECEECKQDWAPSFWET